MTTFSWPALDVSRKLSVEEATELAARVAELTRAGLPLGAGLRALAGELSSRRLAHVVLGLADRLDAGDDLAAAIDALGSRLPSPLRGLVLAGLRSGQLPEVLEQYVDIEHSQADLHRRLWSSLIYPLVLMAAMTALAVVARVFVMPGFVEIFRNFGAQLPFLTQWFIYSSGPMMWGMVTILCLFALVPTLLAVAPRARWTWPLLYRVPMLGPVLRWGHLAQFGRLMDLLLGQQVPLPDSLQLAAEGLREGNLAAACRHVADDVGRGRALHESLADQRQFPASMIPLIEWGERAAALPDAFRATAEMFEGRARSQSSLLGAVLLPLMFLIIINFAGTFVFAMMVPMIYLIRALTGNMYMAPPQPTDYTPAIILCSTAFAGILVVFAAWWLYRARREGGLSYPALFQVAVMGIGQSLMVLLLLVILVAVFGPVGLVGTMIVAFVVIECARKRRASQQSALLWLLAVAAERSMPLGPAIEALATEQGGAFAWRARRLADLLAAGTPLPDALELSPNQVPAYALPMIRLGNQIVALAPALSQASAVHNQHAPLFTALAGKVSYLLVLPFVGAGILTYAMVMIVPKFEAIFRDFRADLPGETTTLIDISYCFINYWYLFLPVFLFFAWLVVYAPVRYFGWTLWDLPLARRLARRLDAARILDGLALVARQQRPLVEGITTLALSYPKPSVRQRLALATFDIEAGWDWADSLARHSLIRPAEHAVLQAAQRAGNLSWAMQEMADSARRRFFYKLQALVQAVFPVVLICFGLVVMYVVVALFLPLVALIQRMA
jgi:protein transport protein HofC